MGRRARSLIAGRRIVSGMARMCCHRRRSGYLGRLRLAPGWRDGAHDLTGGHSACQGANVAVLKRSLWPEGDRDRLLAVRSGTDVVFQGYVNEPEPDFRLGCAPAAGSQTVTFGEFRPDGIGPRRAVLLELNWQLTGQKSICETSPHRGGSLCGTRYRELTRRYARLPLAEERRLILLAQSGSAQSADELVLRHIGFVIFRLHKRVFPELLRRFGNDLLAEAIPVLYAKIQTYDLAYRDQDGQPKPVKFVSYIWKRIDGFILDSLREELRNDRLFREHPLTE